MSGDNLDYFYAVQTPIKEITMREIIYILMRRDHLSENEARNLVEDCMEEVETAIAGGHYIEAEDIFMDWLGLEPDYLMQVLI